MSKRQQLRGKFRQADLGNAALGFLTQVNFDKDAERVGTGKFGAGAIQTLGEGEIVDGIDGMKQSGGLGGFIALQVADQVPGSGQIFDGIALPFPLLDAIFAEMTEAGVECFLNGAGGMSFGDGDQRDLAGIARSTGRGGGDAVLDAAQMVCDFGGHGHSPARTNRRFNRQQKNRSMSVLEIGRSIDCREAFLRLH